MEMYGSVKTNEIKFAYKILMFFFLHNITVVSHKLC